MKDMKEFWNGRTKKYGHTGWSDNFIYAYDQQAKLLAVERVLSSLTCNESVALDFGTGSGDFANFLSKYFNRVIAFDISDTVIEIAKRRYGNVKNIEFHSGDNIEEIGILQPVDLILSVGVLDSIMDDFELTKALGHFQNILREDGIVIAFECALDYEKPKAYYQRFTKFEEWGSLFLNAGFYLDKVYGFYHPVEHPCDSYLSYRMRIKGVRGRILRLFGKYVSYRTVNEYLNRLATKHLQGKDDFFGEGNEKQSLTKIMTFRKLE